MEATKTSTPTKHEINIDSNYFEIDSFPLQQPSKRPSHLETRLSARKRHISPVVELDQADSRRKLIIQERQDRLSKRMDRIKLVVSQHKEQTSLEKREIQSTLKRELENADNNRETKLHAKSEKMGQRVERAKTKAKQVSERKRERATRVKQELDQKTSDTTMRRLILMKIPRSKLLDESSLEVELVRYRLAVGKIQRWWRRAQLEKAINEYKKIGLLPLASGAKPLSFAKLAAFLQNQRVLKATSKVLMGLKKLSVEGKKRKFKNPSRVFLSSWIIVHHAGQWMSEIGDLEMKVKKAAEKMMASFALILEGSRGAELDNFVISWAEYHGLFDEWKAKDTEQVLSYMFEHFVQLEQLWESVKGHPDVESHWKPQIKKQQTMIQDKVAKIGGKSALGRFLEGHQAFLNEISDAGSEAEALSGTESSSSRRVRHDSVNNSTYLTDDESSPETVARENSKGKAKEVKVAAPIDEVKIMSEYGGLLSNEKLAHELIMNPDFELASLTNNKPGNEIEEQIKKTMKNAFFDSIREQTQKGEFSWVQGMVTEIKVAILSMLNEGGKLYNEIVESLDEHLIHQQVSKGVFDAQNFVSFVVGRMLQLCAPIRDAAIREITQHSGDLVKQLEMILTNLDAMKLDLANFRLTSLRPHLLKQAVEYERSKFQKAYELKQVSIEKTRQWLLTAAKGMNETLSSRNPDKVFHPENRVKYDAIYFEALLSMIFNNEKLITDVPETLAMDFERICGFQNEAQAITVVASIVMLVKNFVPELREDVKACENLKKQLFVLMEDPKTTVEHLSLQVISTANQAVAAKQRKQDASISDAQVGMIKAMVDKTMSCSDTVYTLLNRRISKIILAHLVNGKQRRDSTNTGLEIVEKEVDSLSQRIFNLAKHNRIVYAQWYDEILSNE